MPDWFKSFFFPTVWPIFPSFLFDYMLKMLLWSSCAPTVLFNLTFKLGRWVTYTHDHLSFLIYLLVFQLICLFSYLAPPPLSALEGSSPNMFTIHKYFPASVNWDGHCEDVFLIVITEYLFFSASVVFIRSSSSWPQSFLHRHFSQDSYLSSQGQRTPLPSYSDTWITSAALVTPHL